jgi:hypothetical protein
VAALPRASTYYINVVICMFSQDLLVDYQ